MTKRDTDDVPDADEQAKNNPWPTFHDRRSDKAMDGKGPRGL